MKHKLFALIITLFTTTSLFAQSGTCGDNLTWTLQDSTLTISGTGQMNNYSSADATPWYSVRGSISNLIIYNSVTSIGNDAFYNCSSLTSVTIPNSVTSIGASAFSGCSSLTSVTIPNSVTTIFGAAFFGCSSLTSVTIPNSVTNIWSAVFFGCSSLTSVTIPNSVTEIDGSTFRDCSSLTSVTIPNSVTCIGDNTFYNCSSLTSVTIPNSVTSIGDYAFYNCSSLTSVTIPNSVTSIGDNAFSNCSSLTSLTIPNSVTSIGGTAFNGCSGLTSIIVNPGNTIYDSRSNCNAIIETSTNAVIAGCQNTIIPNSVVSIGGTAFSGCSSLTSITIPKSVTSIGRDAFYGCSGLTSVVWNARNFSHFTSQYSPFSSMRTITSFVFGDSIQFIPAYICYGLSGLTSITIPNSVISIGNTAFSGCSGLTSVTIPNSVTDIGASAFSGCSGLTSITIPFSVTIIGNKAFGNCSNLESVVWNAKNVRDFSSGNPFSDSKSKITSFVFGDNVEHIPAGLCGSMKNLSSLTIPNSVKRIGNHAFAFCSSLTSITIPNSVTNIGDYAFSGCSGLTSITIPDGVVSIGIGSSAFDRCSSIDSIIWNAKSCQDFSTTPFYDIRSQITAFIFGDSVRSIPNNLCYGMTNLSSVTIPENVTDIGPNTFAGCLSIDSIIWNARNCDDLTSSLFYDSRDSVVSFMLGDSVKHISANLCNGLKRLKKFTVPASVESMGDNVFVGCDSLIKVDICNLFTWCNTDFTVVSTPLRTAELYINGVKPTKLEIPDGVTRVGAHAFGNCSQVAEISLPPSVIEIGSCAFSNGNRLQTITLDSTLEVIGDSAFANCPYLLTIYANIEFPPVINYSVFTNCGTLSGIDCYVPKGSLAFYKKTAVWQNFNLHEMETDLETIDMDQSSSGTKKLFHNGHLYILLPDGTRFDATGKKVE